LAATDEYDVQGSVSSISWIRHQCRMSSHAAAERVCVGEEVERLPLSIEALEDGRIGFAHLALMARTSNALHESPTTQSFDESALLASATELSVGRFRHVCLDARHAGDLEGYAAEEARSVEDRALELNTGEDGFVFIRGLLDSAGGAVLRTALEPLAMKSGADDDRHRDRRLADALVELAGHGLDSGAVPQRASQRAHLQVTASLDTLLGTLGSAAADMEFSLPISSRIVERLACDATITRVLLGPDSAVIDVGRSCRVVPGSTRRALNVRDKCCQWPGCERPASWTEAHHLYPLDPRWQDQPQQPGAPVSPPPLDGPRGRLADRPRWLGPHPHHPAGVLPKPPPVPPRSRPPHGRLIRGWCTAAPSHGRSRSHLR
jgi:hypothetical protein